MQHKNDSLDVKVSKPVIKPSSPHFVGKAEQTLRFVLTKDTTMKNSDKGRMASVVTGCPPRRGGPKIGRMEPSRLVEQKSTSRLRVCPSGDPNTAGTQVPSKSPVVPATSQKRGACRVRFSPALPGSKTEPARSQCQANREIESLVTDITGHTSAPVSSNKLSAYLIVRSIAIVFATWKKFFNGKPQERERFVSSLRKTQQRILQLDECYHQKFVKYYHDEFLAGIFRSVDVAPSKPTFLDQPLYSGWCRRVIARAIATRTKSSLSFLFSLQKGIKTQWPSLPPKEIIAAVEKNRAAMTRPVDTLSAEMSQMISLVSKSLFGRISELTSFVPSAGATLENKRMDLGALGMVSPFVPSEQGDPLHTLSIAKRLKEHADWRDDEYSRIFLKAKEAVWDRELESDTIVSAGCEIRNLSLREPSKVRTIGLSNGYVSNALRPLQAEMITAWKSSRHSTMMLDSLHAAVTRLQEQVPFLPLFCSGDYSSATDLQKRACTFAALSGLKSAPPAIVTLANESFGASHCTWAEDRVTGVVQEGQPMGHVLSFPLLCCVNLSVYYQAVNRYSSCSQFHAIAAENNLTPAELKRILRCAVFVNGDDILFKGTPYFFSIFDQLAAECGFVKSAGKNYWSTDMCIMNSQVFMIKPDRVIRVGYLNQSVLFGVNELGTKASARQQKDRTEVVPLVFNPYYIAQSLNKLVPFCPQMKDLIPCVFDRFASKFKGRDGAYPNWFLPPRLGGLGIDPLFCDKEVVYTRYQRKIAAHLMSNPSDVRKFKWCFNPAKENKPIKNFGPPVNAEWLSPLQALYSLESGWSVLSKVDSCGARSLTHQWVAHKILPPTEEEITAKPLMYRTIRTPKWCPPATQERVVQEMQKVRVFPKGLLLPDIPLMRFPRVDVVLSRVPFLGFDE